VAVKISGANIYLCWPGNELCGSGVGTRVAADQYALDTISLQSIVQNIYKRIEPKPLIIAPGGFFDADWFKEFIDKATTSVNVVTRHIYNLGAGRYSNI
jgi:heparanase 1